MAAGTFDIQEELRNLPSAPGVYLHHNAEGEIIYIGKAKNLKNRVSQYFQTGRDRSVKIRMMVSHIAYFEYIMTPTENDALLLENRLIKKYMPRYNTLLKDGKTYPYIKLTTGDAYPRLMKVRNVYKDRHKYYGPYPHEAAVNEIIDLLNAVYHLKSCSMKLPEDAGKKRACLNYHINRCDAPCENRISQEDYAEKIVQVRKYLDGNSSDLILYLRKEMEEASSRMEYERAGEWKELLFSAKRIRDELSKRKDWKIIEQNEERIRTDEVQTRGAVRELSDMLGIPYAARMESFDISNTSGAESVGSMVVYVDGRPKKSDYRKFKIKTVEGPDDYASMAEVLRRRLTHTGDGSFDVLPDLLMIDGGKGQVNAVLEVIDELIEEGRKNLAGLHVCGMVKDDRHRTRGIMFRDEEYIMPRTSESFKLVTRIQDETHRFAIEFHRKLHSKGQLHSVLDDIEGIGPKRRTALIRRFRSLDNIKAATLQELCDVPEMNTKAAQNIIDYFSL
ncbi:MAG: excinuclease ABC subunit UvrC [Parasporobacterium sp.]|nr:excinuclease ABC subunit UvrC [Parasporobacterium sp.]